jgi:Uncharacterized protein conserved in bacteria (DUF2252)
MANAEERTGPGGRSPSSAVDHLSVAERVDKGKRARKRVPRRSSADFEPPSTRPDPIGLLEEQAATRVAELVLMQASSDIFLGWERTSVIDGVPRDFYVRQLKDWKGSIDPDVVDLTELAASGRACGWTLAQARSGDRIALAAYLGAGPAFDHAMAAYAEAYADQNQLDFEARQQAAASGRITAQTGL